jgi:predicted transcriptional regulator
MAHVYRDGLSTGRGWQNLEGGGRWFSRARPNTQVRRELVLPSGSSLRATASPPKRADGQPTGNRQIGIPWIINGQRHARAGRLLVDRWQPVARVPRRDDHHYACPREAILAGDKTFEFRRLRFKRDVRTIVLYAWSPSCKVVGEFTLEEVLTLNSTTCGETTYHGGGIERSYFDEYFEGRSTGHALKVKRTRRYRSPLCLAEGFWDQPSASVVLLSRRLYVRLSRPQVLTQVGGANTIGDRDTILRRKLSWRVTSNPRWRR